MQKWDLIWNTREMLNTPFQGFLVKTVMLGEKMLSDNMVENKTYYKVK